MKKSALLIALLLTASFILVSCGSGTNIVKPPSGLTTRVFASQDVSGQSSFAGISIINGSNDTVARASGISAGTSPTLMAISSDRSTLLIFDSASNAIQVINTKTEASIGSIQLGATTESIVALDSGFGYAAVPAATLIGNPPGAVEVMNLTSGGIAATIAVPQAETVVASPSGTQLLVFSTPANNFTGTLTVVSPLLVNTGNTVTTTVGGFDHPAYALFSSDGSTAYVLNCGPECASSSAGASVQTLNMSTFAVGSPIAVDGATIGWLNGSTLYVAGTPAASIGNPSPNNSCTGETTAAKTCGRLDAIDLGSMTVTASAVITDGYHDRIDMSSNGQLFIGSHGCTTIGDVNNVQGEVRGCLSIFNTASGAVVIPPDNGDVTGLQSFTSRSVEYVVEGTKLRVYDTLIDKLIPNNNFITNGTIILTGQIMDVKAVDFF